MPCSGVCSPSLLQVAVGRRPELTVFGDDYDTPDGTGVRDYIHVMDLADGHTAALRKIMGTPDLGCVVYNLGTGKSVPHDVVSGRILPSDAPTIFPYSHGDLCLVRLCRGRGGRRDWFAVVTQGDERLGDGGQL